MGWRLQGPESYVTVDLGCWHFPISGPDAAAVAVDNPERLIFAGALAVAAALVAWGAHRRSLLGGCAAALARPAGGRRAVRRVVADARDRARPLVVRFGGCDRAGCARRPASWASRIPDVPASVLMTTATGHEMTSHSIATRAAEFRDLPDSPPRSAGWWRTELDACEEPTVFMVRNDAPEAAALAAQRPRIASGGAGGRFIAYASCGSRPAKAPV